MEVFINQQSYKLGRNSSLSAVLTALEITAARGIALAVNNKIVPRSRWDKFPLQEKDRITLIRATQGG